MMHEVVMVERVGARAEKGTDIKLNDTTSAAIEASRGAMRTNCDGGISHITCSQSTSS